jgi:hypothetical protein
MRRAVIVTAAALALVPSAAAARSSSHPVLERYFARVSVQIHSYRTLFRGLDALLRRPPLTNVDPLVEKLNRYADRFDALRSPWASIAAPHGLRLRHEGMGRAFRLFRDALWIEAAALFTRHREELAAAQPKVLARLLTVGYLQRRWAGALRGALTRAEIRVPLWLGRLAQG